MKLKTVYLVLCVLGAVLPLWQLWPWLAANGLDVPLLFRQLFADRVGAFFGVDVIVSAVVLVVFVVSEGPRVHLRWLAVVATLAVGVSLGLPLFLYMRERELERPIHARARA
jgi:surface polysaccharide O-acyltransferase-like enzyme